MATPRTTSELDSVALETELLSTWQDEKLFEATVENRAKGEPFIFLEGRLLRTVNREFTTLLQGPTRT